MRAALLTLPQPADPSSLIWSGPLPSAFRAPWYSFPSVVICPPRSTLGMLSSSAVSGFRSGSTPCMAKTASESRSTSTSNDCAMGAMLTFRSMMQTLDFWMPSKAEKRTTVSGLPTLFSRGESMSRTEETLPKMAPVMPTDTSSSDAVATSMNDSTASDAAGAFSSWTTARSPSTSVAEMVNCWDLVFRSVFTARGQCTSGGVLMSMRTSTSAGWQLFVPLTHSL